MKFMLTTPAEYLSVGTAQAPAVISSILLNDGWGKPGNRRLLQCNKAGIESMDQLLRVEPNAIQYVVFGLSDESGKIMDHNNATIEPEKVSEIEIKLVWPYQVATIG
jgi:hypothetical protein